jgi:hypothetical protein
VKVSGVDCDLQFVDEEKTSLLTRFASNDVFGLLPDQALDFQTRDMDPGIFAQAFHRVQSRGSAGNSAKIEANCHYDVFVDLLGFLPLPLGQYSLFKALSFPNDESSHSGNTDSGDADSLRSLLSNVHFESNSVTFASSPSSYSLDRYLPDGLQEFLVNIPAVCQEIVFESENAEEVDGWKVCLEEQTIDLASSDGSSSIKFTFSALNEKDQHTTTAVSTLPSVIFSPLGKTVHNVFVGNDVTVTVRPSETNILNSIGGAQYSRTLSITRSSNNQNYYYRANAFIGSIFNDADDRPECLSLVNELLGVPFSLSYCDRHGTHMFSVNLADSNSVSLVHIRFNITS